MTDSFVTGVVSLVKSALTGKPEVLPENFDIEEAFRFAISHNIAVLMYYGIINSGVKLPTELADGFLVVAGRGIARCEHQKAELDRIYEEFEKNGIDFMPLKGTVIRSLYPKEEMRAMGDADILIHTEQYDAIRSIMKSLGFSEGDVWDNEIKWFKGAVCIELHSKLVSSYNKDFCAYFGDGWRLSSMSSDSKHRYIMTDEDCFVYVFTHFAKHYRHWGVGIRHIIDVFVYLHSKPDMDMEYIKAQFKSLGLMTFYENVLKTFEVWFNGAEPDKVTDLITKKIMSSGSFGNDDSANKQRAVQEMKHSGSKNAKRARVLQTLFPSFDNMCLHFPVLKKAPLLLPFVWVWRAIKSVFFKKGRLQGVYNEVRTLSTDEVLEFENEIIAVGLDCDFEVK